MTTKSRKPGSWYHCSRSQNDINVIVCDKQSHMQYLDMDSAIKHCTKGLGIWPWASNDQGEEPEVVMAGCGDIPTKEALAATALLREAFPDLKIRFINVVDLFRMTPESEHPHGLSDSDFDPGAGQKIQVDAEGPDRCRQS